MSFRICDFVGVSSMRALDSDNAITNIVNFDLGNNNNFTNDSDKAGEANLKRLSICIFFNYVSLKKSKFILQIDYYVCN